MRKPDRMPHKGSRRPQNRPTQPAPCVLSGFTASPGYAGVFAFVTICKTFAVRVIIRRNLKIAETRAVFFCAVFLALFVLFGG